MRLLLDTHALAWWADRAPELSSRAHEAIGSPLNRVFVSPVSIFEAALKHKMGKWPQVTLLLTDVAGYLAQQSFTDLPLTIEQAQIAGALPLTHKDPFDRLLVAQALVDDLTLVSIDDHLDQFGVTRLW